MEVSFVYSALVSANSHATTEFALILSSVVMAFVIAETFRMKNIAKF